MTRLVIDNSGRSGVIANMTVAEFRAAVYQPGTDEDQARYRIFVSNHKTADQYGSAVIWAYEDLHRMMDMYLRTVRKTKKQRHINPKEIKIIKGSSESYLIGNSKAYEITKEPSLFH